MKKILLDTSFLIDIVKFRIPLEELGNLSHGRYQLLVPAPVEKELRENSSKHAKVALKLLNNVRLLHTEEKSVDRAILKLANKDTLVATNDKTLRAKLKKAGIKTIYIRAKKRLAMD